MYEQAAGDGVQKKTKIYSNMMIYNVSILSESSSG